MQIGQHITSLVQIPEQFAPVMAMMAHATSAYFLLDIEGRCIFANPAAGRLTGYAPAELEGCSLHEKLHPGCQRGPDNPEGPCALLRLVTDQAQCAMDAVLNHRDGHPLQARLVATPLVHAGQMLAIVLEATAIPTDDLFREAVRQSEERYRALMEITDDGIWEWDLQTNEVTWSRLLYDMHGMSPEAYQPDFDNFLELVHPEDRLLVTEALAAHIERGEPYVLEMRKRHHDGHYLTCFARGQVLRDESGAPYRMVGTVLDITDRRKDQQALGETLKQLSDVKFALDASTIIAMTDRHGTITYVNDAFCKISQYSPGELLGQNHRIINSGYHPHEFFKEMWATIRRGQVWKGEIRNRARDGSHYWVDTTIVPFLDEQGQPYQYVAIRHDITERVKVTEAIRESEARFRSLADASPVIIYISGQAGLAYVNKTGLEYFGFPQETLQGDGWRTVVHPDDLDGFFRHCQDAAGRLENFEVEVRARRHDGQYRWLLVSGAPRLLEGNQLAGYVGVAIDITDRKEAERDLLEYKERLEHSNRELDDFATIASHDLQAPLRKIRFFADMLTDRVDEEGRDTLERMHKSVEKMQCFIKDLLQFSRVTRKGEPFRPASLNAVMKEVLDNLAVPVGEARATFQLEELATVEADKRQMEQLFQNLISNAIKFRRPDVPLIIRISGRQEGDMYRITIEDNGIGFDPAHAQRIFDPFERLHGEQAYPGTGMGLAICKKIAERHGGQIWAESCPDGGAVFHVRLPLTHSAAG